MAAARNATARHVLQGVFAGDLAPLEAALTKTEEPQPQRAARWSRMLTSPAGRLGDFARVEVMGTTAIARGADTELVTWVRLHFDRGQRVRRLHWQEDRIRGLGGDAWPYPFYGPLRFETDERGLVFNFAAGRALHLRFDIEPGQRASSLALEIGAGVVHAQRAQQAPD